jgi:hypothetical protein
MLGEKPRIWYWHQLTSTHTIEFIVGIALSSISSTDLNAKLRTLYDMRRYYYFYFIFF